MNLIDTHTHLYSDQFNEDRDQMIQKAINEGIDGFFLPNIDSKSIKGMKELVEKYPSNCFPMMGLHPCSVNADYKKELDLMSGEIEKNKFIAIGEIGMDLYWDKTFVKEQEEAFRTQINWAKSKKLPIVIHCREAFEEILQILDEENDENLTGIFHCFTGNIDQAKHILNYGNFKLGIGGVVTFKNSGLDKVVKQLSLENLVLETDSPYLAPAPYRGKRNESAYLINVADKLSDIFEVSVKEVAKQTTENALDIFTLAK